MPTSSSNRPWSARGHLRRSTNLDRLKGLLATLPLLFATGSAVAVEILYIYAPDCPACSKFDAEVGRIYPKSLEAERMPMRRILLNDWRSGQAAESSCVSRPIVGTPTFLLIHNCAELDRISGYSTDEGFWMSLARLNRIAATQEP